ncbi:hypothetical protein B0O80DRAFT_475567 [Mortierella sp. GBAus27b]|nr:hypothetical protein B0O80DRAFT_475567 [Mortierella sp. GBAus27b]
MNPAQITYISTSSDGEFSLRTWALLGDVRDPNRLDLLWTMNATPLLQSQKERGVRIRKRIRKLSRKERMAVFSRVKEDKDHKDNMRAIVNDHLRLLSQGVNQDLAQDARAKRRLQDAEQRGPKKLRRCMDKALQGSSRTSATSKSASTSASASTSSSRLATTPSVAPSYSSTPVKPLASASSVAASTSTTTIGHSDLMLDTKTARTITTTIMGHKLSGPFQQLQVQAASVVNNLKEKATLDKLHLFMAANHIWMSSTPLPGLPQQAHDSIARSFRGDEHLLSEHMQALCKEFSSELAETGRVRARAMDTEEEEDLMLLYQNMSKKLPREFFAWVQNNKDTFAHGAIDIILRHIFPENTPPYELDWVNRPASGSKARRGDPLKPDATVIKSAVEVAYVEIMAPKDSSSQTKFVEDQWNLASEARDLIDLHLRNQRQVTVVPCLQVFGYKVKLFKMEYVGGLYIWTEVAAGYLPRDHHDLDVVPRLLSLFARLKTILNGINVQIPPQQLPDELLPEDARPQPVNISPTMRPFFPKLRRP